MYYTFFSGDGKKQPIIDLCLSDFPEIFAIHKGFSDKEIKKFTNGTYKSK